ncbi:uncharacterized protein TRUGW13939_10329 [Talaromyces rugulosus]|uniref:FAD-binding PCMH-type domain-containing protein n=1 Tax=Talaromyces rugulosus TaxID=121627 RepID=A0A7H8R9R9_TALRU|nr:uncharacterized protein TRUGW13939_10329 [Talaromyces rugulosus]QKX63160.1 hypothetical protein TRUGW13939_10329 [Talaromyces rugulosus]
MGKSTGKGSLSLWTHYLNTSQIVTNYSSDYYTGPAVKAGAGVIAGFLYKIVFDAGYRVVGGTCASVGIAGGYAAGGGHSLINGLYGMAADNVLEWEVVTAQGEHIIATPNNQIHPDGEIGGASLTYNGSNVDADVFWNAIEAWYAYLPSYTDGLNGGNTVEFEITATTFSAISFTIPGASTSDIDILLDSYLKQLQDLGIEY